MKVNDATGFCEEMVLYFNPADCDDPITAVVFRLPVARTLYLLWRQGHIVSQHFSLAVLEIAYRIVETHPPTVEQLAACFRIGTYTPDFIRPDVQRFCERALPYFTGELTMGFRVECRGEEEDN